jgi:hypothetical protein
VAGSVEFCGSFGCKHEKLQNDCGLMQGNFEGRSEISVTLVIAGIQSGFSTAVNELHAQKLDIKPS